MMRLGRESSKTRDERKNDEKPRDSRDRESSKYKDRDYKDRDKERDRSQKDKYNSDRKRKEETQQQSRASSFKERVIDTAGSGGRYETSSSANDKKDKKKDKKRDKDNKEKDKSNKKKKKRKHKESMGNDTDDAKSATTPVQDELITLEKSPVNEAGKSSSKERDQSYDDISSPDVKRTPSEKSPPPSDAEPLTPPSSTENTPSRSPTPERSPTPIRKRTYYPAIEGCRNVEEFNWLNRIEEGTYGVVYRARDKRTGKWFFVLSFAISVYKYYIVIFIQDGLISTQ